MDLFHSIDAILYINLDHRIDRKEALCKELKRLKVNEEKIFRIPGIYDACNGNRGCLLAHIKALEFARNRQWKRILILEDDVIFHENQEKIKAQLTNFFIQTEDKWDIFLLGGSYVEKEATAWEGFWRIRNSWCAHAYVVHHLYIEKLLVCFLLGVDLMKEHLFYFQSYTSSLDQMWKVLQKKDTWYASKEQLAFQRQSASDIETVLDPLREFAQVIYIEGRQKSFSLAELQRLRINENKIFRIKDRGKGALDNHLRALECAIERGGRNAFIVDDHTPFIEDLEILDRRISIFMKWRGFDHDLFLFDHSPKYVIKTEHPDFSRIVESKEIKCYGITSLYYQTFYELLKKEQRMYLRDSLRSFQSNLPLCLK